MKLRNKKTGEIVLLENARAKSSDQYFSGSIVLTLVNGESLYNMEYSTLESIMEEWEDYEEPKAYYIGRCGTIEEFDTTKDVALTEMLKEIGNYFETEEETEKEVEKLKAWKRLKDKGFKASKWVASLGDDNYKIGEVMVGFDIDDVYDGNVPDDTEKDLDLLFGGEE